MNVCPVTSVPSESRTRTLPSAVTMKRLEKKSTLLAETSRLVGGAATARTVALAHNATASAKRTGRRM